VRRAARDTVPLWQLSEIITMRTSSAKPDHSS
jgi:hypothetical protein